MWCLSYKNVADDCFALEAFYKFGLSWLVFEIRTILSTLIFVNMSSNLVAVVITDLP